MGYMVFAKHLDQELGLSLTRGSLQLPPLPLLSLARQNFTLSLAIPHPRLMWAPSEQNPGLGKPLFVVFATMVPPRPPPGEAEGKISVMEEPATGCHSCPTKPRRNSCRGGGKPQK